MTTTKGEPERDWRELEKEFWSKCTSKEGFVRSEDMLEWFKERLKEAVESERARIGSRVGFLRQWLNERPKDILITNEDIELWLELDSKPIIKEAVKKV